MATTDTTERVHLSVAGAGVLSELAMRGIGYDSEEAHILADHVIDAAVCGYEYSGLPKLPNVADYPRFKAPRSPLRVVRETGVSVLFDGGNQNGRRRALAAEIAAIKATPRQEGVDAIRVPGERVYHGGARLACEGIEIDRRIQDALIKLADGTHA